MFCLFRGCVGDCGGCWVIMGGPPKTTAAGPDPSAQRGRVLPGLVRQAHLSGRPGRPHDLARAGGPGMHAGRTVSRVGYGAMQLRRLDREAAIALLRRAVELGIDHVDTAHFCPHNGHTSPGLALTCSAAAHRARPVGQISARSSGRQAGRPRRVRVRLPGPGVDSGALPYVDALP